MENIISIYKRKILRCIFRGIQENGTWRRRSNFELYRSYKEPDIVNFIKVQRIKWAGHIVRMDEDHTTKKVFNAKPIGTRRKGSQILDGLMALKKNLLVLRTKNWKALADGYRFNSCQVIYSLFGLAIHQNDHQARRRFVEWAQNEFAVVPDFHKRILFSDEAHFWLNGYVNKQNCRIWSEANSQVYVETPLHPEKLTVWGSLWAGGIIGPCFFKNDEGHNVTVNGDWYRAMITNFFIPELNNHDVQEM
ncbi:uncharacterized protein TNCV_1053801 [Trichonephila clavipes]|nr:uncharacterized protein TNCV_1053801 [Trichonephila clavipes]